MTELSIVLKLKDEASAQMKKFEEQIGLTQKQMKQAGLAITGFGVATVGALGMATKAAAEEEKGIVQLSSALKNVGVNYDDVKKSLEGTITAQQKKTAVADDQQRRAMVTLINITGNYEQALKLLPMTMDMAIGKEMDLASAATVVGRVSTGNTEILNRYGIELAEGATATEALAELQGRFSGQAEAYGQSTAGAMANVTNSFGDMQETMGTILLPVMEEVAKALSTLMGIFASMPEPVQKVIVIGGLLVGSLALIAGPITTLIALIPTLAAGLGVLGTAFTVATGPIGIATLAIAAIIAAGVLLVKNWDHVKAGVSAAWNFIKDAMAIPINAMIGYYEFWANAVIKAVNLIIGALNTINVSIPDWVPGIGGKGFGINLPKVSEISIPRLAEGGIVTRPTVAMIGEAGPEAVVPLGRGGMGQTINIYTQALMGNEAEAREFARKILSYVRDDNRTRTYGRAA